MILTNLVEAVLICYIVDKDSTWVGVEIFPAKTFAIFNLTMWVPVVDRTKRVKPFLACGVPNRKVHLPKKNRMEHLNMDLFCGCLLITCCPLTVTFLFMNAAWKSESVGFSMQVKFPGTFFMVFGHENLLLWLSLCSAYPQTGLKGGALKSVLVFGTIFLSDRNDKTNPQSCKKEERTKRQLLRK